MAGKKGVVRHEWKYGSRADASAEKVCSKCGARSRHEPIPGSTSERIVYSTDGGATWHTQGQLGGRIPPCEAPR